MPSPIDPLEPAGNSRQYQRQGDFFDLRREYRAAALTALRRREGLPLPVDDKGQELETRFDDLGHAHYYNQAGEKVERVLWSGTGRDGKPGSLAIGKRKGADREVAEVSWGREDAEFEILEVAEDGRKLADELRDLDRDAALVEMAGKVSHGVKSEQAPDLVLDGTGDEEMERKLQEYIKRGPQ